MSYLINISYVVTIVPLYTSVTDSENKDTLFLIKLSFVYLKVEHEPHLQCAWIKSVLEYKFFSHYQLDCAVVKGVER